MIFRPYLIFIMIFLFSLLNIYAEETETEPEAEEEIRIEIAEAKTADSSAQSSSVISAAEAEAYLGSEYNRGNYNTGKIMLSAGIELKEFVFFKGGLALNQNTIGTDIDSFFSARFSPFTKKYLSPLSFSASYIYNGILDLDVHTHSILPFISYMTDRAGASVGISLRFTSFFGEEPQFESILSFYVYFNFIKTESFILGAGCGTFDDFNARNMAALWLNLNATIKINKLLSIYSKLEWMQSGLDGLTATFYGISFKGGVKFSW